MHCPVVDATPASFTFPRLSLRSVKKPLRLAGAWVLLLAAALAPSASPAQTSLNPALPTVPGMSSADASDAMPGMGGPLRLRQPGTTTTAAPERAGAPVFVPPAPEAPYVQGEFERHVQAQVPSAVNIRRLGAELVTGDGRSAELSPLVPADYVLSPGDEVLVTLWGAVDADLRLVVDRAGRISIPRVGTVQVSGVRHADLADVVNRRVAQVFRNFQSSVSLGQLRGIRVFVTGFVARPGAYTVSSLSSVVAALMGAGGPTAAGSFRNVELRRGGELVTRFDLYDLLLAGDRTADRIVQAGDVVHVNAVGTQVGFIGSVNKPAVLELKPGETVKDALRMVGGFSAVADRSRLALERLAERTSGRVSQLELPRDTGATLSDGDVVRAFSAVAAALPAGRQSKRVIVEGEVARPAEYVLPEGSSVRDAIRAAGGLTAGAFVYATELTRESVRLTQQENYDRALRDLETDLARASGSQRVSSGDDAAVQSARAAANTRLIDRLRALKPTGRIVLQLAPDSTELPDIALEDGDRIFVPARPTTVGVFGSVFNGASYLYAAGRTVGDYLRLAGGPTKGADESSIFVVRANGNVVSNRQSSTFFAREGRLRELVTDPGDTVFVPEETDKTTFLQAAKDWTQILFQFGLGVAGIKSAVR